MNGSPVGFVQTPVKIYFLEIRCGHGRLECVSLHCSRPISCRLAYPGSADSELVWCLHARRQLGGKLIRTLVPRGLHRVPSRIVESSCSGCLRSSGRPERCRRLRCLHGERILLPDKFPRIVCLANCVAGPLLSNGGLGAHRASCHARPLLLQSLLHFRQSRLLMLRALRVTFQDEAQRGSILL